ncbi:MAG: redoxin domain-containing protein, partial [Bacillota bacterium]
MKLEGELKSRDARVKVIHDKTGVLFDDFGVTDVPQICLARGREIVYRHTGYIPAFDSRLATILAWFSQDKQIPESFQDRQLVVGERAPDIVLPDIFGRTWHSVEYHQKSGRSRILYLFTIMSCDPCRQAADFLASNARKLKDVEVIVVSFGPRQVTVKEMERRNLPFTILCDVSFETYMRYCISGTPTLVLTENRTVTY